MGVSGILVVVQPEHLDACLRTLASLPGVETHQVDSPTGRIVVTHVADDLQGHEEGLRRIQGIRDVVLAELVYHYAGDEPESGCEGGDGRGSEARCSAPSNAER